MIYDLISPVAPSLMLHSKTEANSVAKSHLNKKLN